MRPSVLPFSRFRALSVALFAGSVLLSGCGGGGGTAAHVPVVYDGPTTLATITSGNAQEIYDTVWNTAQVAEEGGYHKPGTVGAGTTNTLASLIQNAMHQAVAEANSRAFSKVTGTQVQQGSGGNGTRTITFNIADDNTGTIGVVYNNFADGTVTLNGTMDVAVANYNQAGGFLISGASTLIGFRAVSAGTDYIMDGTVGANTFSTGEGITFNIQGRDNVSGNTFWMENLFWIGLYIDITAEPACRTTFSLNGTMYLAPYGQMTVSSNTFTYSPTSCVNDHPSSGGPLVISGADGGSGPATITMVPLSASQYRLDVDVDGDTIPTTGSAQNWGAF
jgi:hypothetical protein